jgi:hypothetical protein
VAEVGLTTNQKGAIAEAAITKAAVELGVEVYRPVIEGGRYDMIFGLEKRLIRVQCKWAGIYRGVLRRARGLLSHPVRRCRYESRRPPRHHARSQQSTSACPERQRIRLRR